MPRQYFWKIDEATEDRLYSLSLDTTTAVLRQYQFFNIPFWINKNSYTIVGIHQIDSMFGVERHSVFSFAFGYYAEKFPDGTATWVVPHSDPIKFSHIWYESFGKPHQIINLTSLIRF